jgi:hypothetical protein
MSLAIPKKRPATKKRLFIGIKKKSRARAMQSLNAQLRRAGHRARVQFKYIYSMSSLGITIGENMSLLDL